MIVVAFRVAALVFSFISFISHELANRTRVRIRAGQAADGAGGSTNGDARPHV